MEHSTKMYTSYRIQTIEMKCKNKWMEKNKSQIKQNGQQIQCNCKMQQKDKKKNHFKCALRVTIQGQAVIVLSI